MTILPVPYVDTRAGELHWRLGLDPLPALVTRTLRLGGGTVELRLLGSSHQVLLSRGAFSLSEVVACLPGGEGELPPRERTDVAGAAYAFTSRVMRVPGTRLFAAVVRALVARAGRHRGGLVGTFPGVPGAATVLQASQTRHGVRWRTWHTYPQTGEIVATRSEVRWA